uniref:Uncharacterized protein n=1 Tax=Chromera velia CCMP2878 TaxID=1169474 RepID=A0A0G4HJ09_9ALVE|eukprot:Cvel_7037.t1-p1 / transcript=Cvel_7037.t1 / gene=Cvel_7037 / organism=Chromera_velia_CCMP2878 / gene_product=hypothetical protein / transcript_product=hypothetical protein / location=Cvel_scaffold359:39207-39527(+) / protein_length=107 / sequence_SO=supercontig / SO=protein_coding / is_pseudo=false
MAGEFKMAGECAWSAYEFIFDRRRNGLKQEHQDALVSVYTNMKLVRMHRKKGGVRREGVWKGKAEGLPMWQDGAVVEEVGGDEVLTERLAALGLQPVEPFLNSDEES